MATEVFEKFLKDNFEYYLTTHCNLKCSQCSMHSPYLNEEYAELESLKKDLAVLKNHMRVKRLRLLGGEPTLHPHINDFIKEFKRVNFADNIELVTNGTTLFTLSDEFFRLIDSIHISKYPETGMNYEKMNGYLHNIRRTINPKLQWLFEKTIAFGEFHIDNEVDEKTAKEHFSKCELPVEWGCNGFKDGRLFKCSFSSVINKFYQQTGRTPPYDFFNEDSISIHDPNLSAQSIRDYIFSDEPLKACRICKGSAFALKVYRKQQTPQEIKYVREIKFVKNNRNISSSS